MGTKGVPHNCEISMEDFAACLHDGKPFHVELQTLTKKKNMMSRVKTVKKGLNRLFVKFPIAEDGITCSPLFADGRYL